MCSVDPKERRSFGSKQLETNHPYQHRLQSRRLHKDYELKGDDCGQQTGFMQGIYLGDQGLVLRLMMDNAKTVKSANKEEFEEYMGVMLDNNKDYDRVHPHYLAQALQKFGFPIESVRCIENLFLYNEVFINIVVPESPQLSVKIKVLLMGKDVCVIEQHGISYDD
ncbi:hypothetical protein PS15m_008647 [Mucor circinelloides]